MNSKKKIREFVLLEKSTPRKKKKKVAPLTIGSRDVGTLIHSAGSNRPQSGAALVGRELGRYKRQQP